MTTASELLLQGKKEQVWKKYCGFLDLSLDEFMQIQERLLGEQLAYLGASPLGRRLLGIEPPGSLGEFRSRVPLTTYDDYAGDFDAKDDDALPEKPFLWAHTSGRSGIKKWFPYSEPSFHKLGEQVLGGVILASARRHGEVRVEEWDTLLSNTPPRPYISGVVLRALAEQFNFNFIPALEKTEDMEFQERITTGFKTAMKTGIDVLGSISVVLVKMGESFEQGANTSGSLSLDMLHPKVILRYLRGFVKSKRAGRPVLPKDLWSIKAIVTGGMDVSIYKERIAYYWGVLPFEQYGSTEVGVLASHSWTKDGMTFLPDAAFLEFLPLEELDKLKADPAYIPKTDLMNEVQTDKIYELVATSFHGNSLVRYRTNDLMKFTTLQDENSGVALPQMEFVSRMAGVIDLSGFSGIMDEKLFWQAMVKSGIPYEDWVIRKEASDGKARLHLYIETSSDLESQVIGRRVNDSLKQLNPYYADFTEMIDENPFLVTILSPGTFSGYMLAMVEAGANLAHLKPPHMNASDEVVQTLLRVNNQSA